MPSVIARSPCDEAIQGPRAVAPGLLRCARNDGGVDAAIIGHRLIINWSAVGCALAKLIRQARIERSLRIGSTIYKLAERRKGITNPHSPCFAQTARTCSPVANSPPDYGERFRAQAHLRSGENEGLGSGCDRRPHPRRGFVQATRGRHVGALRGSGEQILQGRQASDDRRNAELLSRTQDRPRDVHGRRGVPDRQPPHSQRGGHRRRTRKQRHHDRLRQHRSRTRA